MLKYRLLHPELLSALGRMGHHSRVLIADGNYPYESCAPADAEVVYLNLRPDMLRVTDVLETLLDAVNVQTAFLMLTQDGERLPLHDEYRRMIGETVTYVERKKTDFYEEVKHPYTRLIIATGETRRFANLLLEIGVVRFDGK